MFNNLSRRSLPKLTQGNLGDYHQKNTDDKTKKSRRCKGLTYYLMLRIHISWQHIIEHKLRLISFHRGGAEESIVIFKSGIYQSSKQTLRVFLVPWWFQKFETCYSQENNKTRHISFITDLRASDVQF